MSNRSEAIHGAGRFDVAPRDADDDRDAVALRSQSDSSSALTKSWSGHRQPQRLGNYEIVARLGQGGMGKVYKAWHRNLKRHFALKTLRTDVAATSEAINRFYREMEAIGRINHLNVVHATDAGPIDGVDCLVMEYLEGVDLGSLLRQTASVPLEVACELVAQAAQGLEAITGFGLVHRDIKPSNLFLTTTGQLKILDLGLARLGVDDEYTRRGEVYGTADYIAPEVALGLGEYDSKADVYSLGCTFYKLLAGVAPFESAEYDSFASKLQAHTSATPPSLNDRIPAVPREILALLDRMLAKKPADRPTAADVVTQLEAFTSSNARSQLARLAIEHALVVEHLEGEHFSSTPIGKSLVPTKPDVPWVSRVVQRRPWGGGVAVGLAFLLPLLAVAMWWSVGREDPAPASSAAADRGPRLRSLPVGNSHAAIPLRVKDSPLTILEWTGRDRVSSWEISDDFNSLEIQTDAIGMIALDSMGGGEHTFSVDVERIDWKSGLWGIFYAYQTAEQGRLIRYERIACVANTKGNYNLSRALVRIDRESPITKQSFLGKAVVDLDRRRNQIELRFNDQQLIEVLFNGVAQPSLIGSTDPPPDPGEGMIGVYCSIAAASFFTPKLDGAMLQLHQPGTTP